MKRHEASIFMVIKLVKKTILDIFRAHSFKARLTSLFIKRYRWQKYHYGGRYRADYSLRAAASGHCPFVTPAG